MILYWIFLIDKQSNVVIAGDLNKLAMEKTKFLKDQYSLQRVNPEEINAHCKGGVLDGVWTNMKVTSCSLTEDLK